MYEGLGKFVEESFENAGRRITPEAVDVLLGLGQGHTYRTQQLAFHVFRLSGEKPTNEESASRWDASYAPARAPSLEPTPLLKMYCLGEDVAAGPLSKVVDLPQLSLPPMSATEAGRPGRVDRPD